MFTIEKITAIPNPEIPQWRVSDQARRVALSVRILKSNDRAWCLYAERWANNKWTVIERIGERESQALAYCEAGAWLATAPAGAGCQGQVAPFVEDVGR